MTIGMTSRRTSSAAERAPHARRRGPGGSAVLALALALLIAAWPGPASAQLARLWSAGFNGAHGALDAASAVAVDLAGNAYVAGGSMQADSTFRGVVLKFDPGGGLVWSHLFVGPGVADWLTHVRVDQAGHVIAGGVSQEPDTTLRAVWFKLTPGGGVLWTRRDAGPSATLLADLEVGPGDAVYATRVEAHAPLPWPHGLLPPAAVLTTKCSPAGTPLWTAFGTTRSPVAVLALDPAGNAYVVTSGLGDTLGLPHHKDISVTKHDAATGALQWSAGYDSPGHGDEAAVAAALSPSGHLFVTGTSVAAGDSLPSRMLTLQIDPAGNVAWSALRANAHALVPAALAVSPGDQVYVAGRSCSDCDGCGIELVKYGLGGSLLWEREVPALKAGGAAAAADVALDAQGNPFVAGVASGPSFQSLDMLVAAYSSAGTLVDVDHYDAGGRGDEPADCEFHPDGSLTVAGTSAIPGADQDIALLRYAPVPVAAPHSPGRPAVVSVEAYPNPGTLRTVRFALPERSRVSLVVHDLAGRVVHEAFRDRVFDAGVHSAPIAGARLADGVYFLRLSGRALDAGGTRVESARRAVIIRR